MTKNRDLLFGKAGWEDYLYWQREDKKILKKINSLIAEILRDPFTGIGKPEPLRNEFSGLWSRRIDDEHRLIYAIDNDKIIITQCRYHYSK
jgi:toxin YoeB